MEAINQPDSAISRVFAAITNTPSTIPAVIQNRRDSAGRVGDCRKYPADGAIRLVYRLHGGFRQQWGRVQLLLSGGNNPFFGYRTYCRALRRETGNSRGDL